MYALSAELDSVISFEEDLKKIKALYEAHGFTIPLGSPDV